MCDFFCVVSLFCGVVLSIFSSIVIVLAVLCVLCLCPTLPWVGLQSVIVAFPGHTHLLFHRFRHYLIFLFDYEL